MGPYRDARHAVGIFVSVFFEVFAVLGRDEMRVDIDLLGWTHVERSCEAEERCVRWNEMNRREKETIRVAGYEGELEDACFSKDEMYQRAFQRLIASGRSTWYA
jgi:hypothetical protein